MVKSAFARATEFEPIDRLEDKVKTLVSLVSKLRADHLRATEDNADRKSTRLNSSHT